MVVFTLLLPIACLFLIVLRRAYLNLPYTRWIRRYTIIILARFIILLDLSFVHQILDLMQMLYFPICLIDYILICRRFYCLLVGRNFEARWHSTQSEYRAKRRIAVQFFYAQILTIVCFSLVLIDFLTVFILSSLVIVLKKPNFFNKISFPQSFCQAVANLSLFQCLIPFLYSKLLFCLYYCYITYSHIC